MSTIAVLTRPRRFAHLRWLESVAIWVALGALFGVGCALSPYFFTTQNVLNLLNQASVPGIVALGVTGVMITGGVDLSVGSVITLTSAVGATVMNGNNANIPIAIVACLVCGAVVGFANGFLVATRNVSSFILTLGMASVVEGAALLYTGGTAAGVLAPGFVSSFGGIAFGSVPTVVVMLFAVLALLLIVEKTTVFGRRTYLVGSNIRAAELGGVPVNRTLIMAYMISGMAAGLAGIVLLARIGVSSGYAGQGYDFLALAAVVLGGTTFEGGRGGVIGSFAGVLILTVAYALVNLVGLVFYVQLIVEGVIIIGAASLYRALQRDT